MRKFENIEVGYYTELSKNDGNRLLSDVLIAIKKGSIQKDVILDIRDKCKKKEDYDSLKKTLEAFTPSGTFNDSRKINNLKTYSGILVLDVDNLGERQLPKLKKKVIACDYTLAAFISPSGTGLKILVRVDTNSNMHSVAFKQVSDYYTTELDNEINSKENTVSRLCPISYDSDIYVNLDAQVFQVIDSFQSKYQLAVDETLKKEQFEGDNRQNFIQLLATNCNQLGMPELIANKYILDKYDYEGGDLSKTIETAYNNSTDFNIIEKSKNSIEAYLLRKYRFRYNTYTGSIEHKRVSEKVFKELKDYELMSYLRELKSNDFKIQISTLHNLLQSDFSPKHDPLMEYLKSLPDWDKKTDYISELASKLKTDDDEFFNTAFKRWFVAMIACGINEQIHNQAMIIMTGGQGIGKSTFIRNLLPPELQNYIYSGMIHTNSKDTLIQLSENLIIDLDELSNLTRKSNSELKEIITKSRVKLRRAYGRMTENLTRRASFIGSINEEEFLTDLTGNRRYLSFKVISIDYKSPVNYSGVYSQAFSLFKEGFKFYFDKEDIDYINERNEIFRRKSPIEETLLKTYKPAKIASKAHFYLSTTELLVEMATNTKMQMTDTNFIQLGKIMTKLGFQRVKKKGSYKYAIDLVTEERETSSLKIA